MRRRGTRAKRLSGHAASRGAASPTCPTPMVKRKDLLRLYDESNSWCGQHRARARIDPCKHDSQ